MPKSTENYLDDCSPFDTGIGGYLNMVRIGFGEGRGWIELHTHGEAEVYSPNYPDDPVFSFNAEDADVLIHLGKELSTMVEAWKEHQREAPAVASGEDEDDEDEEEGAGATIEMPPARKVAAAINPGTILESSPTAGRQERLELSKAGD